MAINSRRKGARTERRLVDLLQQAGFAAEKVSRSGYPGPDLSIPLLGQDLRCEVKCRGDGFKEIYRWLAPDVDLLVVKADRLEPLVILRFRLATEIAQAAEHSRNDARVAAGRCDHSGARALGPLSDD
jgi:hypothetical protein